MGNGSNFRKFFKEESKFVYYNDLERTYPNIYKRLMTRKRYISDNSSSRLQSIGERMKNWSIIEAQKEIQLLNSYFGVNLSFDTSHLYSKEFAKELIDTINYSLQFKGTYERFLTRILGPNEKAGTAKITGAQFFADYFSDELRKIIEKKLENVDVNKSLTEVGENILTEDVIDEAVETAIYRAFFIRLKESGDWSARDENHGYQEMLEAIEQNDNLRSDLLREVKELYKIDKLKVSLREAILDNKQFERLRNKKGKGVVKKLLKQTATMKGTLAEILAQKGFAAIAEKMKSTKDIQVDYKVIGGVLGKTDIAVTFGLDYSKIQETLESHYANRAERVKAYKGLNSTLSFLKDGFIIYTNVKDYSLVKKEMTNGYKFSNTGFSAGEKINLKNLEGVISYTPGGSADLIGDIMSTMEGAVYEKLTSQLETELVQKMAYFLFDDVTTIGKETAASSHAIHLLVLDGIYIPLSFLFKLMSEAILGVEDALRRETNEIFKVTIDSGEIEWPYGTNNDPSNPIWKPGAWKKQKAIAYENIKIGARFLRSFVDILSEYLGKSR